MKRCNLNLVATVLLLCGILLPVSASAQATGTVRGIVKDNTGAVLPGTAVTLTDKGTQRKAETLSNEVGVYSFAAVPPGQHMLTFDMAGFRRLVRDTVTVNVTETVVIDAVMEVGDLAQEITVSGEAPLVQ